MKVTKKRIDFLNLLQGFGALGSLSGFRISYAVMRIKNKLISEEKVALGMKAVKKEHKEFNDKRNELAKSYARKDPLGNPLQLNKDGVLNWDIPDEEYATFEKDLDELKAQYPGVYEARNKQMDELNDWLLEETTIDFYDLKKSDVPDNITVQQLELIGPFMVDDEE